MKQKKIVKNNNVFIVFLSLFVVFVAIFIGFNLFEKNKKAEDPNNLLVGVWQDMPSIAAGYSNRYHFFKDGTYSFVTSQMDCESNLRQIDGTWKIEDNKLLLIKSLISENVKGKKVKASGSCETKYELVNYETNMMEADKWCQINKCNITTNSELSKISKDEKSAGSYLKTNINGVDYWKFSDDPKHDSPAPIGGNVKADDFK